MKHLIAAFLITFTLIPNTWATLDIEDAPIALELTDSLESKILKDTERELLGKNPIHILKDHLLINNPD